MSHNSNIQNLEMKIKQIESENSSLKEKIKQVEKDRIEYLQNVSH